MKKLLILAVLFSCCLCLNVSAQTSPVLSNITAKLQTLSTTRAIEKTYLHFDKPYYAAGDTIYFKAYVAIGERHTLTKLSGIAYVDLVNDRGIIKQSVKLQLTEGIGWGDFALPDTLQKGNYRVRAYTQWMRNTDDGYFFDQVIPIGSISDNRVAESAGTAGSAKTDVQFFPEGGTFVTYLDNKVAFKATGTNGLGVSVKGLIVDNTNAEVARFASTKLGMGSFTIKPEDGKTYKAIINYPGGSKSTFDLPKPDTKGITLAVNDTLNKLAIEIRSNKPYYQENQNKDYYLVIYSGGFVVKVAPKLDGRILAMDVLKSQFPTGIVQITLFSPAGEPIAERLCFVQNNDLLKLAVTANKTAFTKRENVQISLNAKSKDGAAAMGHFSVAVIDESKVPVNEDTEHTILNYLLLTSDLKGYIEQPNYYFANNTPDTKTALDALMLTQGYRRFNWKQLMNDNTSVADIKYQPETAMEISGVIKEASGSLPAKENVILRAADGSYFNSAAIDQQGQFKFAVNYLDKTDFIIQPEKQSKKAPQKIILNLDRPSAPVSALNIPVSNTDVNAVLSTYLNNEKLQQQQSDLPLKAINLKNVNVHDKKNDYRSSNLGGSGHADQVIKGDDIVNAPTLSIGLNGLLRGVDFAQGVPFLKTAAVVTGGGEVQNKMLVILDGANLGNADVDNIPVNSVETVELLKSANTSIYGVQGGAGVLIITTRQSSYVPAVTTSAVGQLEFKPKGFYKAREFYQPKYTNAALTNNADLRSTIFWQPELATDKDGNASVNYFNADGTGSYRVVIEGIDNAGNLGRQVIRYTVK